MSVCMQEVLRPLWSRLLLVKILYVPYILWLIFFQLNISIFLLFVFCYIVEVIYKTMLHSCLFVRSSVRLCNLSLQGLIRIILAMSAHMKLVRWNRTRVNEQFSDDTPIYLSSTRLQILLSAYVFLSVCTGCWSPYLDAFLKKNRICFL